MCFIANILNSRIRAFKRPQMFSQTAIIRHGSSPIIYLREGGIIDHLAPGDTFARYATDYIRQIAIK